MCFITFLLPNVFGNSKEKRTKKNLASQKKVSKNWLSENNFKKIGGKKIEPKEEKSSKGLDFVQKWPNMRKNMRKNVKYANMRIKVFYAQKVYLLDFDIPSYQWHFILEHCIRESSANQLMRFRMVRKQTPLLL